MAQDIITLSELRTKIRVGTGNDAELTQIIAEVEAAFQGAIRQNLISTAYIEVRTGNGAQVLNLYRYPVVSLATVAIENESNVTLTSDHIRYGTGVDSDGSLELVSRVWSVGAPRNITVSYTAGYANQAAVKAAMPDAWAALLDAAAQSWFDMKSREKGIASQSYMDGSISYFGIESLSERFREGRWDPVVKKYLRRRSMPIGAM
jgi:hypothetical protein